MEGTRSGRPLLAASARPRAAVLLAGCAVLVAVLGVVFAHQSTSPVPGSIPCKAFDAGTSNCGFPSTSTSTGVVWSKATLGRFFSQRTSPDAAS